MKQKIPSKIITVCDCCKRESQCLTACETCGKEYCLTCEAIIYGCVHTVYVCRECGKNEKVRAVVERFVTPLAQVLKKRSRALKSLRDTLKPSDKKEGA